MSEYTFNFKTGAKSDIQEDNKVELNDVVAKDKTSPKQLIINSLVDQQKEFKEWYDHSGLISINSRNVHLTSEYFTELFGDDYEIDVDGFLNDSQFTISRYVDGVKFIAVVDADDH